ncbi:hypothetical protein ACETAC_07820 [Aceticella autotrophica]|uniref:Uncharacterized protein n=1 Tax=Aceticella autotrophica TaxID=2755338 RepID=A0A975AUN3_9THEO|nr:hypothetical protein [Aceticella autotrophica]QSZ26791.1 hypothetical protein ACETAC_07820 [Aceticella autotrophica]
MVKILKETFKNPIRRQLFSNIKDAKISYNEIIIKIINKVRNITEFFGVHNN